MEIIQNRVRGMIRPALLGTAAILLLTNCDNPTELKPLGAPINLLADVESVDSVLLTWVDNSSAEDGFIIEQSLSPDAGFAEIGRIESGAQAFMVTELELDTRYLYRIQAYNNGGDSGYSNTRSVTIEYGAKIGNIATDFTSTDQDSQDVRLYDHSGKVIVLSFGADWCVPCRVEAPQLDDLFNEYRSRGLQVINLLMAGEPAVWAEAFDLSYPVLNEHDLNNWNAYGDGFIPLNVVIDPNYVIRYKKSEYDESALREIIERYLPPR